MDKCFFLIVADRHSPIFDHTSPAYEFLQSFFSSTQSNSVIYIIVPNLATLRQFRDEFPGANCILLDIDKTAETVKSLIVLLPEIEVIMDFTGKFYTQILRWVPTRQPAATVELKTKRLNLVELSTIWNANNSVMPVLINVLPPKDGQNIVKDAAQAVKKKGAKVIDALKSDNRTQLIRFKPGPKFSATVASGSRRSLPASLGKAENSLSRLERGQEQSDHFFFSSPLLGHPQNDEVEITLSSLIFWLRSNCCFCFGPTPLPTPQFLSEGQLLSYIRGKQHDYTRRKLDTVFEEGEQNLLRFKGNSTSEEEAAIRAKYEDMKKDKTAKYMEIFAKNKENPSTVDLVLKGQASREKTALENIKRVDTDLAKELGELRRRCDAERKLEGEADHYERVVKAELDLLRRATLKFQEMYDQLYAENESNWVAT